MVNHQYVWSYIEKYRCAIYWHHKHPLLDQKNKIRLLQKKTPFLMLKKKKQQNSLVVFPHPIWKICSSKWVHLPQSLVLENSVPKNTSKCHHTWQFCLVTSLGWVHVTLLMVLGDLQLGDEVRCSAAESPGTRKTPESSDRVSFPNVCNAVVGPPRFTRDLKTRGFSRQFFPRNHVDPK